MVLIHHSIQRLRAPAGNQPIVRNNSKGGGGGDCTYVGLYVYVACVYGCMCLYVCI